MKASKACSKAFQQEVRETDRKTCEFLIENEAETLGRRCVNAKRGVVKAQKGIRRAARHVTTGAKEGGS